MKNLIFFVTISTILIFQCSNPTIDDSEMQVNKYGIVFFVFDNTSNQGGLISHSNVNNYNSPDYIANDFVYDAQVFLEYRGLNFQFDTTLANDFGHGIPNNYTIDSIPVINPGDSVQLQVILSGQTDTVIGKTRIPEDINYLTISEDNDSYYVNFEKQEGCSYEAVLYVPYEKSNTGWSQRGDNYCGTENRVSFDKRDIKSGENKLLIYTFDKNFTDHSLHKKDPSGLNGQLGVFSGVNLDKWMVNFEQKTYTKIDT